VAHPLCGVRWFCSRTARKAHSPRNGNGEAPQQNGTRVNSKHIHLWRVLWLELFTTNGGCFLNCLVAAASFLEGYQSASKRRAQLFSDRSRRCVPPSELRTRIARAFTQAATVAALSKRCVARAFRG